jgi:hypothetical protein
MDTAAFVHDLLRENQSRLHQLRPRETLEADVGKHLSIVDLLRAALKNEMEALEIAARWLPVTPEPDVKVALARQAGDEAKHYRLVQDRLRALGVDTENFDPVAGNYSPLFQYLAGLTTTVERAAAGQFTREQLAVLKNQQFAEFCREAGDLETAKLYSDVIGPDEQYHHQLGIRILEKYATSPELQEEARGAARRTLDFADEMQRFALVRLRTARGPGC